MDTPAPPPLLAIRDGAAGSTFLIMVEVLLWTLYTVGVIMVMVVVMMQ